MTLVIRTVPGVPPASVIVLLRPPAAVGSYWTLLSPLPVSPLIWATVTASLPARPALRPVSVRLPPVPAIVTLVPPVAAPTVICPFPGAPPVCWTSPTVPLLTPAVRLVIAVVLPAMFAVLPAMLAVFPATVVLVAASWLPLTASVDVGLRTPAATLWTATGDPAAVPTSVVLFDTTPGVGVVGAAGFEYCSGPAADEAAISPLTWPRSTASVPATPGATFDSTCAAPGAAPVPPAAVSTRLFAAGPRCTVPAVPVLRLTIAVVLPAILAVLPAMFAVLVAMLAVLPATVALVAASWLPLTASVDAGVSAPGPTFVTVTGPAAPPARVTRLVRTPPAVVS